MNLSRGIGIRYGSLPGLLPEGGGPGVWHKCLISDDTERRMQIGIELLLVAAAAYALGLTFDVLLGGLLQAYPGSDDLAVGALSLIAAALFIFAFKLSAHNRWLVLPLAALGALALFSVLAVVGGEKG